MASVTGPTGSVPYEGYKKPKTEETKEAENKSSRYKFEGIAGFVNPNIKYASIDSSFDIGSFEIKAGVLGVHDPSQTVQKNVPYIYDSNTNSYLVTGKNGTVYALKKNGSTYDAYNYNLVTGAVGTKVSGAVDLVSNTENKTDQVFLFFISAMYKHYLNDAKTHSIGIGPRFGSSGYAPGVQKVYLQMLNTFGPNNRVLRDLVGNPNTKPNSGSGAIEGYLATKDELKAVRFFVGASVFEGSSKLNPFFTFLANTNFEIKDGNTKYHVNLFGMYEFARLSGVKDFLDVYSNQAQNNTGSSYGLTGIGVEGGVENRKGFGKFLLSYALYVREGTVDSNPITANDTYTNTNTAHVVTAKYSPTDLNWLTLSAFYMYSSSVTVPQNYPTVSSSQHTIGIGADVTKAFDQNWLATFFVRAYFTSESNKSPILVTNGGSVSEVTSDPFRVIVGAKFKIGNEGADMSERDLIASARREIVRDLVKAVPKEGKSEEEETVYESLNSELAKSGLQQKAGLISLVQSQTFTKPLAKVVKDLFPKNPKEAAKFKLALKSIVKDVNKLTAKIDELSAEMAQRKGIDVDEAKKAVMAYIGGIYGINYNELVLAVRQIESAKV